MDIILTFIMEGTLAIRNYASRKTCEYAGGMLMEIVELPEGNDMRDRGEFEKCIYEFILCKE